LHILSISFSHFLFLLLSPHFFQPRRQSLAPVPKVIIMLPLHLPMYQMGPFQVLMLSILITNFNFPCKI
jgi:hypothetical protein